MHLKITFNVDLLALMPVQPMDVYQSINQYIYNAPWYRGACYSADYAETKRNVLSRILNVLTDGAVRQFRGREFQSLPLSSLEQSCTHDQCNVTAIPSPRAVIRCSTSRATR